METTVHYLTFDEVGITFAVVGIALAFIVLVWNAVKAIHDWRAMAKKPESDKIEDHERRISHLEECCADVRGKLEHDWEFQQNVGEFHELMLLSIKQLLKHGMDGNDVDGLAQMEDEIDKYLIRHNNHAG